MFAFSPALYSCSSPESGAVICIHVVGKLFTLPSTLVPGIDNVANVSAHFGSIGTNDCICGYQPHRFIRWIHQRRTRDSRWLSAWRACDSRTLGVACESEERPLTHPVTRDAGIGMHSAQALIYGPNIYCPLLSALYCLKNNCLRRFSETSGLTSPALQPSYCSSPGAFRSIPRQEVRSMSVVHTPVMYTRSSILQHKPVWGGVRQRLPGAENASPTPRSSMHRRCISDLLQNIVHLQDCR